MLISEAIKDLQAILDRDGDMPLMDEDGDEADNIEVDTAVSVNDTDDVMTAAIISF